ncbi:MULTISPECIES: CpsD/CapB family tyrosine-protein kinase [Methylobacterium]|jgi:Mrp family chromosome partitioning ATPase|uniref:Mrp family chromosome partitioning ATPase n=2 Tax=Methylobacterium TaxID=407 RepID=A0ABR6D3X9_9HYPH|nr:MULTISPECIES: CpsD/CapB family tyrosine-protein kinase [Methylobacterium]KOX46399.1 chromosome partitioning protein [Streptomyces purpurogeneiscleroticus]AWV14632.1 chromosome partitioning protein [Methylobacterium sp. XJLW]MBA9060802.1 Mrp family chromosome partitioning ATPase [Methylobacterium fujisawaense]MDH3029788.1 CpsD/CapB family tyrosine-protein kinase [Methylobacterium fujisawaense]RUP15083.1 MAG: tyrosine-protein kinase family protein [Methylobacterium sp.]
MIAAAAAPRIDPAILEPALVQLTRNEARVRRVGITAVQTGEGVSTLARELAGAYARRGRSAVLIEANWSRPSLAEAYGLIGRPGFADIVAGAVAPSRGVHAVADGLSVVPAGTPAAIRKATLDDGRVEDFLALVDERFDLALVDCEPITEIGDAAALSPFVDGFIVVIGAERTRRAVAQQALADLRAAGGAPLGVVLNRTRRPIPKWLYRWLG